MRLLLGVLTFLLLVYSIPSLSFNSNSDSPNRDDKKTFVLVDNLILHSAIKIQYDKPRIVIKSVYPELLLQEDSDNNNEFDTDGFNDTIDELVQQAHADFIRYVQQHSAIPDTTTKKKYRNDFFLDYDSSFIRPYHKPLISVRFSTQGMVTGLAHPYHRHFVLNYDLKTGETLELADLFKEDSDYLNVISSYARTFLTRRLEDKQFIEQGTTPQIENFKNWNIKANGILFTFDEAQVAPYYLGAQSVLVPYTALKDILKSDSIIGKCAIRKGRCGTDLVLTGGFIDEAAAPPKHARLWAKK